MRVCERESVCVLLGMSLCGYAEVQCRLLQAFADEFIRTIKRYSGRGAGIPIKTNSKGDAEAPFQVIVEPTSNGSDHRESYSRA